MKLPKKCHIHEKQTFRGSKRRRDEEQIRTTQTLHMKPQTHTQRSAAISQPGYPREETLHTWLSKLPQGRVLSDWTSSQTDLRPRLEQLSKGTFSDVATQMIKSLGCLVVLAGDECGGSYSSSFGVLMSPNYPEAYSHDEFCVWIIIVNDTERVTFTMMELDLEDDTDCRLDYVEVTSNVLHNERIILAYAANASQDRLDLHVIIIANRINKFYRIYCQTEKKTWSDYAYMEAYLGLRCSHMA